MAKRTSQTTLGPGAVRAIERAVAEVFDRAKVRVLGPQSGPKQLAVSYNRHFSLPGLFEAASREEGVAPNVDALAQVLRVAEGYLDAVKERTVARTVAAVQAFVRDAHAAGESPDLETVLGGQLAEVWGTAVDGARRVIDAEANHTKNVGLLDGVVRVNAVSGVDDPVVYFATVPDKHRCAECERLHLLEDGVTPRVWRLSEVGHGYHKKGDENPKMSGLHPHCRCCLCTLLPGYGFSKGAVSYVGPKHDEFAAQRGQG